MFLYQIPNFANSGDIKEGGAIYVNNYNTFNIVIINNTFSDITVENSGDVLDLVVDYNCINDIHIDNSSFYKCNSNNS